MSQETMIQVDDLKKDYGSTQALRGISFEVHRGEVLGFLGPNGAGKTTTMKILTCYMAPTSGTAFVGTHSVTEASLSVRQQIGYLPEDTPIYSDMTTLEFLEFVANIRQVAPDTRTRRLRELVGVCGLTDVLAKPVGDLSKGFRQRVGLAQALIHDPPILIFDEPTSGLDPLQRIEVRTLLGELADEHTVLISSHILPEVQATCGRVIIISAGQLVADGTPQELSAQDADNAVRLLLDPGDTARDEVDTKLLGIDGVSKVSDVEGENGALGLMVASDGDRDLRRDLFGCARDNGWVLLEMQRQAASLEDVFRKLTRTES